MRKLLPESWGFLCPVHTPDGSPCGLLNHFTASCRVVTHEQESPEDTHRAIVKARFAALRCAVLGGVQALHPCTHWFGVSTLSALLTIPVCPFLQVLSGLGMVPSQPLLPMLPPPLNLAVHLDGRVVGSVRAGLVPAMVAHLRAIKAARLAEEEDLTPGAWGVVGAEVIEVWEWGLGCGARAVPWSLGAAWNGCGRPSACLLVPVLLLASSPHCLHALTQPHSPCPDPAGARLMELYGEEREVPPHMEIVHIAHEVGGVYPGLFLFTEVSAAHAALHLCCACLAPRVVRPRRALPQTVALTSPLPPRAAGGAADPAGASDCQRGGGAGGVAGATQPEHSRARRRRGRVARAALHALGWVGGRGWPAEWGTACSGGGGRVGGSHVFFGPKALASLLILPPHSPQPSRPLHSQSSTPTRCCRWWPR